MDKETKDGLFLVLMFILILLLLMMIILFVKYKNIIVTDALTYGMEKHEFQYCLCIDKSGETWESYEGGFIKNKKEQVIFNGTG